MYIVPWLEMCSEWKIFPAEGIGPVLKWNQVMFTDSRQVLMSATTTKQEGVQRGRKMSRGQSGFREHYWRRVSIFVRTYRPLLVAPGECLVLSERAIVELEEGGEWQYGRIPSHLRAEASP